MNNSDHFANLAADQKRQAEASTLINVRERCLRSEAAYTEMAARARRTEERAEHLRAEKDTGK